MWFVQFSRINNCDSVSGELLKVSGSTLPGVGKGRGRFGSQCPQARHLFQLAIDPMVDLACLAEIFLCRHYFSPFPASAFLTSSTEVTITATPPAVTILLRVLVYPIYLK